MADSPAITVETGPDQGFEIVLAADPKPILGKTRAPVVVEVNGYVYRSTVAAMNGGWFVPFRKSHREAAGLDPARTYPVTLTLDTETPHGRGPRRPARRDSRRGRGKRVGQASLHPPARARRSDRGGEEARHPRPPHRRLRADVARMSRARHDGEMSRQITSQQLDRDPIRTAREAADHPIIVTEDGRPSYVLLSHRQYQRLLAGETSHDER